MRAAPRTPDSGYWATPLGLSSGAPPPGLRTLCDMFLDLELEGEQWQRGSELAEAVEEAACAVVADMACPTPPQRCRLSCVEAGPAAWSCGPTHAY